MVKNTYSIGHSNLDIDDFIQLLKKYNIDLILDVRSVPHSKMYQHFNREKLKNILIKNNISYIYLGMKLGGRQNIDYTKYLNTNEYKDGIELLKRAQSHGEVPAIMCAESDFRFCHRRFICKTLIEEGFEIKHITTKKKDTDINVNEQITIPGVIEDNEKN